MPISRNDWKKYQDRLPEFYGCLTKVKYWTRFEATKQSYAIESIRPGRVYTVYRCLYCGFFHVGRRPKHERNEILKLSK